MADDVAIEGLDGVLDAMGKLTDKVQRKIVTAAARKGANVIRDRARSNAARVDDPQTPESIAKNIVTQAMSKRRVPDGVGMRVGVLGGAKQYKKNKTNERKGRVGESYAVGGHKDNPGGDTFYWRFLEFGTADVKAEPFMRPAMEEEKTAAFDAVAASLQQAIFGE